MPLAPAMRHRRRGLPVSTYRLSGLGKGDEHQPTLQEGHGTLFTLIKSIKNTELFYCHFSRLPQLTSSLPEITRKPTATVGAEEQMSILVPNSTQ